MKQTSPIPSVGFGTGPLTEEQVCKETVRLALDVGFRHIDTAQMYQNERFIGEAVEASPYSPTDLFLATKVHPANLAYDDVIASAESSRDRLGVDTIDLLYVHWPVMAYDPDETLPAFEALWEQGLINHIGLSNFTPSLLIEAVEQLSAPVLAHQIEMHPLLQQRELFALAQKLDHYLVAYSPLARGKVLKNDVVRSLAEEYSLSPAQVALAWLLSKEIIRPIPFSANRRHLRENLQVRDLDYTEMDLSEIEAISREERVVAHDLNQEFS